MTIVFVSTSNGKLWYYNTKTQLFYPTFKKMFGEKYAKNTMADMESNSLTAGSEKMSDFIVNGKYYPGVYPYYAS